MIIKTIDDISERISELSALKRETLDNSTQSYIKKEIHAIKKGHTGEQNSAYFINERFNKDHFLILHDLRLELDDMSIAQIDHLIINAKINLITLIETKNHTASIMIDEQGTFYSKKGKAKHAIESPLQQSLRHERALSKVFKEIDFKPSHIQHIVLYTRNATINKPSIGFENVCYTDELSEYYQAFIKKLSLVKMGKILGKALLNKMLSDTVSPMEVAELLKLRHRPLKPNYRQRFKIDDTRAQNLTLHKAAVFHNTSKNQMTQFLVNTGLLNITNEQVKVTSFGLHAGIEEKTGKYGDYVTLPLSLVKTLKI